MIDLRSQISESTEVNRPYKKGPGPRDQGSGLQRLSPQPSALGPIFAGGKI